jgi:PKD repeat protein
VDGITCNRCHQVSYDPTFPINDQGVNAAPGHTTHETDIFNGWACVKTCFGCHQSTPYVNNGTGNAGQNEVDLANPVALQVKNSGTGGAYLPEFNSHPIGNMFLNSPHGKFTGTMLPNNLGKFDIVEATAVNASAFVGKLCRSSTAVAGGSILETQVNGEPIKTLEECNVANGKTTNLDNNFGYWQDESGDEATGTFTGSCITCHNVHESLFVADAKEPIRRECTTCHNNNDEAKGSYPLAPKVNLANMRHPDGGETPAGQAATDGYEAKACEICHMPKATSAGFPMHLWRVNSSASYRTFPDNTQFTSNTKKVANTAPDGSYTPAVWVDVDYACGQCHGGSFGPAAVKFGAIYKSKAELAIKAANIHNDKPIASFTYGLAYPAIDTVNVYGSSSSCPSGTCNYSWAFGDGGTAMGATATHQYAAGGTYPITLTVQDSETLASASVTNNVNVFLADAAPVAHFTPTAGVQDNCAAIVVGRLASFTDSSTDDHLPLKSVKVSWGDGTMFSNGVSGGLFTHNYLRKGTFTITQMVTDSAGNTNKRVCTGVVVP